MRRFVLGWKKLGLEQSLGTCIVTYADDLVILCRRGKAEEALQQLRTIMGALKLTINEENRRTPATAPPQSILCQDRRQLPQKRRNFLRDSLPNNVAVDIKYAWTNRLRIETMADQGTDGVATRVCALTLEAASPRTSMTRTRAKSNI